MNKEPLSWIGNGVGLVLTALQTNVIFQYISLFLTILATLVSLILSCYNLYQKVKKGQEIDQKDIQKLLGELEEANNKIKELEEEANE